MNGYVRKILVPALLLLGLCMPAYAHPELKVILTDSYPICIYDGEVPVQGSVPVKDWDEGYSSEVAEEILHEQLEYDEWLDLCANTYGIFCTVFTHPKSRDCNQFDVDEEMSAEELMAYVRENWEYLFENDLLVPTQEYPRRTLGEIQEVEYQTISRVYLIPLKDGRTAVLNTPDGYVFLGGTFEPKAYYDSAEKIALMSEQSGWQAVLYHGVVCSAQRFCGDDDTGYYHINEMYRWGDLTDKQETVENLLILPIEDCRGMMATALQNWALEQAILQSQSEGFAKDWQLWKEMWEMTEETAAQRGALLVFDSEDSSAHYADKNKRFAVWTDDFTVTADDVRNFHTRILETIDITDGSKKVYLPAKNTWAYLVTHEDFDYYHFVTANCFMAVAQWAEWLGYNTPMNILEQANSNTDYYTSKMLDEYGEDWTHRGYICV